MPDLFIITGSNGAGKSTVGPDYLPINIQNHYPVFDGDLLYTKKLSELFPGVIRSAKYARQEALNWVVGLFEELTHVAMDNNDHFVYEGHFTNNETWEKPKAFKEAGYKVHLIFFGLDNIELSQFRVTERVTEGGHYVDGTTLMNNFYGNLEKLNIYYSLIDDLTIVDTSKIDHRILLRITDQQIEFCLQRAALPGWFTKFLPNLAALCTE